MLISYVESGLERVGDFFPKSTGHFREACLISTVNHCRYLDIQLPFSFIQTILEQLLVTKFGRRTI